MRPKWTLGYLDQRTGFVWIGLISLHSYFYPSIYLHFIHAQQMQRKSHFFPHNRCLRLDSLLNISDAETAPGRNHQVGSVLLKPADN